MKNFTLLSLVRIALKHIFLLLLAAIVFGAAAFSYFEFLVEPKYSATGSVLVTNGSILVNEDGTYQSTSFNSADLTASINFTTTVSDILKTNGAFQKMAEKLGGEYTYQQLSDMATIQRRDSMSLFIDISFVTNSPEKSVALVNEFLSVAPEYINSYVPGATTATSVAETSSKSFPSTILYSLAAAVFGVALVYFVILLVYSSNTVIQDEEDFSERFDVPVLGSVPDFTSAKTGSAYYKKYGYSKYGYSYSKYGYGYDYGYGYYSKKGGKSRRGN